MAAALDLTPLLRPRSVAVVGATDRPGSYGDATLVNLATLGFPGPVYGVHPTRTEVHGRPCVPTLDDLPEPVDAVVVAIPAAGVPEVVRAAGRRGCGGLVVFGAGFAEAGRGALQAELRAAALAASLPVIGPNCDGMVAFHGGGALWGDALVARPAGRVALVSQSGNVAVNALGVDRGIAFHTVASVGNQAVVSAADVLAALVEDDAVGSVALFLEGDGDGERLAAALARAAEREVGVAVLKVGATMAGAVAAAAHTGSLAGDHRVFRALVEEAGAAWADDIHDLLELAKALAVPGARRRGRPTGGGPPVHGGGLAILTCSGGDSGLAADEAGRRGLALPPLSAATAEALGPLLPDAATVGNPLDYTAMIWGERERLAAIVRAVAADPAVEQLLLFYDEPGGMDRGLRASWDGVREGLADGAVEADAAALVASTLPELLQDASATAFLARGVPAVAGPAHGAGVRGRARPPVGGSGAAARDRLGGARRACGGGRRRACGCVALRGRGEGAAARRGRGGARGARRRGRGRRRRCCRRAGRARRAQGLVTRRSSTRATPARSCSAWPARRAVRTAYRRVAAAGGPDAAVLVEAMAAPGVELVVAARGDAVVPALVVGLGGVWTELLDDVAVVPLPAAPARVEAALRSLRGAGLLTGARGTAPVDLAALAALAAAAGDLLLAEGLALLELNPVIAGPGGAVAVDALARR